MNPTELALLSLVGPLDPRRKIAPRDQLRDLVVTLDGMLTGKPRDAEHNARQREYLFADPLTFVTEVGSDAYYLADGGYSRLMVDEEGVRGLSQVSRQPVKDRWHDPEVQQIVQALDKILRDAVTAASIAPSGKTV